jgi:hypothetical protein
MPIWCDTSKRGLSITRPQNAYDKADVLSCLQRGSNQISDSYKTVLNLQGDNTAIGNNKTRDVGVIYKWDSERTHQAYLPVEQLFSYIDIFNITTAVLFSFCAIMCIDSKFYVASTVHFGMVSAPVRWHHTHETWTTAEFVHLPLKMA